MHIFSCDVEEYFHVSAFERTVAPASWETLPPRADASTDLLLELLARHEAKGTFFVVGWLADRNPALVRRIAAAGHEIASHSWWHRRIPTITREAFREDVARTRARLEDITGQPVRGFRAPSFSILPGMEWAFDVLLETGHTWDSSVFPIRRPGYGWPGAPTAPYTIDRPTGRLREIPLATTSFFGMRFPAAGGAYLRQLPLGLVQRALREHGARGEAAMCYIHPWEVDPGQPRLPCSSLTRIRHYRGLDRTLGRLEQLLREFRFTSVQDRYAA